MKTWIAAIWLAGSVAGCTVFCHVPVVGTYEPECISQRRAEAAALPTATPAP